MDTMGAEERALRERLGVPAEAERIIIFGETSHWDPSWLFTSEEYYTRRIQHVMEDAIEALAREPRRVFSIESLFFFRLFWDRRPDRREALRELVNAGRLRLTGSGITTPDVVLTHTEAVLRDYQLGQQWLWDHGMRQAPALAYLPDDFGYTPALPSLMAALGYDRVGITRIDGMYFVASDLRPRSDFPLRGSSAELLSHTLKTQDFIWRAPDGAEVLCHWNAFSYFQGDMLAHVGVIRWMGRCYGLSWRQPGHVDRQVAGYLAQLEPLARTPYVFCPIGCDFNSPIPGLVELLDRYNERARRRGAKTFAVNGALEDYLALVGCHRDRLPVLELDPNPYWMGFYVSRPAIKRRCNRIVRKLLEAEKLSTLGDAEERTAVLQAELREGWEHAAVINHHDFITGTSPDRVWHAEQARWVRDAEAHADRALALALGWAEYCAGPAARGAPRAAGPRWRLRGGRLVVETRHYRLVIDEACGGCIESLDAIGARPRKLVAGPANDVVAYHDSGGLWRMGHEFRGGTFVETARASALPARVRVEERDGLLEVIVESALRGKPLVRRLWLSDDSPVLRLQLRGAAARRHMITCRFPTSLFAARLAMDVPGGFAERPLRKLFDPTFWPARSFVHMVDEYDGWGLAAFLGGPSCAAVTAEGVLECAALRNVARERAYRVVPLLAHPASGTDPLEGAFEYALWFTPAGDFREAGLPALARTVLHEEWLRPELPQLHALADSAVTVDRGDALVTAAKRATSGDGLVVRLTRIAGGPVSAQLRCRGRRVARALRCDAVERDAEELAVADGAAIVPLERAITSVRLILEPSAPPREPGDPPAARDERSDP